MDLVDAHLKKLSFIVESFLKGYPNPNLIFSCNVLQYNYTSLYIYNLVCISGLDRKPFPWDIEF